MQIQNAHPGDGARDSFDRRRLQLGRESQARLRTAREELSRLSELQAREVRSARFDAQSNAIGQAREAAARQDSIELSESGRDAAGVEDDRRRGPEVSELRQRLAYNDAEPRSDSIDLSPEARRLAAHREEQGGAVEQREQHVAELKRLYQEGRLNSPERVERAAERMLTGPRAE
jgi:hypothetical protein